jgi:hypothetical protein
MQRRDFKLLDRLWKNFPHCHSERNSSATNGLGMTKSCVFPQSVQRTSPQKHYAVWPPSTTNKCPVTKSDALEARNTAAPFKS